MSTKRLAFVSLAVLPVLLLSGTALAAPAPAASCAAQHGDLFACLPQ